MMTTAALTHVPFGWRPPSPRPVLRPTLEERSYESYQAYCRLMGTEPAEFDTWRFYHRKLFGMTSNNGHVISVMD
jgi:hypothetical protein